jgi:hypothetical protein
LIKGIAGIFAALPFFCCINDLPSQIILLLLFAVSLRKEDGVIPAVTNLAPSEQYLRLA